MTTNDIDPRFAPVVRLTETNEAMADSRDVAAYFGKRHKHVLEAIRDLHCSPEFREPNFRPFKIKDLTGESTSHVTMTKDGFAFLVLGFTGGTAALFKERYIAVFNAMEAELRNRPRDPVIPAEFYIPKTLPDALRLAADLAEKVETQSLQIEADKPKVLFFDQFAAADGLYGYMNGGRSLACHPRLFVRWLKTEYLFYEGAALIPYQKWRLRGFFEVTPELDADRKAHPRGWITPRGLQYLSTRIPDEIKLRIAA